MSVKTENIADKPHIITTYHKAPKSCMDCWYSLETGEKVLFSHNYNANGIMTAVKHLATAKPIEEVTL